MSLTIMVVRALFILFLILIIYIANAFANPFPFRENQSQSESVRYGFSYSFEQAAWYGLDPKKFYVELLDMGFDWVRLPFFWDQMTDESDNLKIDDLEFAIEEAAKRDIRVVIALGAKTPYYPEYHLPGYIKDQLKFGDTITTSHPIADDILSVDKKVVEKLYKYDSIGYWQVENEPFLGNVNNWKIDESMLAAEVKMVREADPKKRPIILNHVGPAIFDRRYKKLFPLLVQGDVLGVNAYFKTQGIDLLAFKILDREVHIAWPRWFVFPVQSWLFLSPDFEKIQKEAENHGLEFWVLEVQAEPYLRKASDAGNENFSFNPADIEKAQSLLRSSGVKSIGFWGASFWQYREKLGDESWVRVIGELIGVKLPGD